MANEKRLIDANILIAAKEFVERHLVTGDSDFLKGYLVGINAVIEAANKSPTVDAVEVVRCNKCKKGFQRTQNSKLDFVWCDKWRNIMRSCDFCSYGEREDNGCREY